MNTLRITGMAAFLLLFALSAPAQTYDDFESQTLAPVWSWDHITANSARVPMPPGKTKAASQLSINAYRRSFKVWKRISSWTQQLGETGLQVSI